MDTTCARCEKAFSHTPAGRGRPRKYCDSCRRIDTRRGRYVPAPARLECKVCGVELRDAGAGRRYCSSACKWLARKRQDGIPCEVCGEPTGWTRASGKTSVTHKECGRLACGTVAAYKRGCRCTDCGAAKRQAMRTYAAERKAEGRPLKMPTVRQCVTCGSGFNPRANQLTCSPDCRAAHLGRLGGHYSRAQHYGVEYETIDRSAVFERDGWTCGICELPVDPDEPFPSAGAATLDHVVPMSHGGGHVWANVQLAHFYCNTVKGNRLEEAC